MIAALNGRTLKPSEVMGWVESGAPRAVLDAIVTPEIAALLLTYNDAGVTNRRLRRSLVSGAADALQAGQWENTGEPIIMSDAKLLNDGQHRLQAIVETGLPAIMDLRFGVKRHAFSNTNSGGKRTASDALRITGMHSSHAVSSITRLVVAYQIGLPNSLYRRITNGAIVEAAVRWPEIAEAANLTGNLPSKVRVSAIQALTFFMLRTANEAAVTSFLDVLEKGEGRASNPPHQLREVLMRVGTQDTAVRIRVLALGIIAWNRYRDPDRKPGRLAWRSDEPFPVVDKLKL